MKAVLKTLLLVGALIAPTIAVAQDYPNRIVTMVIPFPPGGTNDLFGRHLTDGLTKLWGKTVVVEHRPGAGTGIGAGHVARARPDGYTLMFVSSSYTSNAAMQKNLPFDPIKDLLPVGMAGYGDRFIITGSRVPMASLQEMQKEAKARKIFYSTSGAGTLSHLSGELLNDALGVNMEAVHYQGGAAAMTDLAGGRVDIFTGGVTDAQNGLGKMIAVMGKKRSAAMPDVPSVVEAGFPNADAPQWWGVFAPAGTPKDIVAKLNKDIVTVMTNPQVVEFMAKQGAEPSRMSADEFAAHVKAELEKWTALATKHNMSVK